ncbi:MAG: 16S rRNA (cytosine(1402)-N(4))-methyltransferase RsmH [candidate division Zixibacteria bacterium]|nr:16S rRNA (cytosine(1402)-N(4))-methyltransferase RsmH [candidate division Zixibacteria bacterium]
MHQRENSPSGHRPVMVDEVVRLLVSDPEGAYLDLTAGGGGHLFALASRLSPNARLYGLDRDPQAVARAEKRLSGVSQKVRIVHGPFDALQRIAAELGVNEFAGILLDLGISSDQIDDPARGFSFQADGPLDMRFDQSGGMTAADLVNTKTEAELTDMIRSFGEERDARRIARAIVRERQTEMILTTQRLADIVSSQVPPPHRTKTRARVFQAIRIAVNNELGRVEEVLPQAVALLATGGRLAVISYHSLEDRIIKQYFRKQSTGYCTCPREIPVCVCGGKPSLNLLTRKSLTPSEAEINANPRARSARLRVAERVRP